MAVLVGIDEAGFGPILGPLVISSAAFEVQQQHLNADWWKTLNKSVGNRRKNLVGRLLITDSKKAYSKTIGLKHIQRTSLACLYLLGKRAKTVNELLSFLCPRCSKRLDDYPWYFENLATALTENTPDIEIASSVFADDLADNNIRMLDIQSCCLDVAHYNKMVSAVKNKSSVLFSATSMLIKSALKLSAGQDLQIIIDRQGGRVHYRKNLQTMFPEMSLTILKETPQNSSYLLESKSQKIKIHFVVKADDKFLPVALASIVSKYVRELLIAGINRYFQSHKPDMKPTAGYWQDGLRFIKDINTYLPDLKFDSNQLIRSR